MTGIYYVCALFSFYRYEIEGCEVVWAIKDETITATFIDAGAAQFFLPHLCDDKDQPRPKKRTKYSVGKSKHFN